MAKVAVSRFVLAPLVLGAVLLACSDDDDDDDDLNNGVDDVKAACEIRNAWTARDAEKCISCQTVAPMKACGCEAFKGFDGACAAQGAAVAAEPTCTEEVDTCVRNCGREQCGCIEGCYANAEACEEATAARDGCVAEVCAKFCNE